MIALRWLGYPHSKSMRIDTGTGTLRLHAPGDVVEVTAESAERIMRDHGSAFEVVPSASSAVPARTGAMPATSYTSRDVLPRTWREAVDAIERGDFDDQIEDLAADEAARAKPRDSVLRALKTRGG